jgi:hypothetical protein
MALHFVAGCAEYPARGHGADARAGGAGLHFRRAEHFPVAPNVQGAFFLGKITIVLYWFLEVFFLSALRFAYRYFRYTRVRASRPDRGCVADAADRPRRGCRGLLRGIESGAVKHLAGRRVVAVGGRSRADDPQHSGAGRDRRFRGRDPRFREARQADCARGDDAVGVRARGAARIRADAGARLGLIVSRLPSLESGDAPRLTPVAVEDLLLRPSEKIDYARLEAW